jgi:Zn-dependent peptidase ImmA (M78 family)
MARPLNRAEREAAALIERFAVEQPPVPLEKIARGLGAEIRYESLAGDLSGALYRSQNGAPVIGVNDWHAEVRQRFTIAHELGHLQLHRETLFVDGVLKRNAESSMAISAREIEANAFAAELLMPRGLLVEQLEARLPTGRPADPKRVVRQLAGLFEVSEQAMQYRLVNLGFTTSF